MVKAGLRLDHDEGTSEEMVEMRMLTDAKISFKAQRASAEFLGIPSTWES